MAFGFLNKIKTHSALSIGALKIKKNGESWATGRLPYASAGGAGYYL